MKTQTEHVLSRFESIEDAAQSTGFPEQTWYNWKRAGSIPHKHHLSIIIKARSASKEIHPADFYAHLVDQLLAHVAPEPAE